MFENHTTLEVMPGKMDEALAILNMEILPLIKTDPGLLSLGLLTNLPVSRIVVLSLWKNRRAAESVEYLPAYQYCARRLAAITRPIRVEPIGWSSLDILANLSSYRN